jgi:hypothetical protein
MQQQNNTSLSMPQLKEKLSRALDPATEQVAVEELFPATGVMRRCGGKEFVLVVYDLSTSGGKAELQGDHKFIVLTGTCEGAEHNYVLAFPTRLVAEHRFMKGALDAFLRDTLGTSRESQFVDGGYLTVKRDGEQLVLRPIARSGYFGQGSPELRKASEGVFSSFSIECKDKN